MVIFSGGPALLRPVSTCLQAPAPWGIGSLSGVSLCGLTRVLSSPQTQQLPTALFTLAQRLQVRSGGRPEVMVLAGRGSHVGARERVSSIPHGGSTEVPVPSLVVSQASSLSSWKPATFLVTRPLPCKACGSTRRPSQASVCSLNPSAFISASGLKGFG